METSGISKTVLDGYLHDIRSPLQRLYSVSDLFEGAFLGHPSAPGYEDKKKLIAAQRMAVEQMSLLCLGMTEESNGGPVRQTLRVRDEIELAVAMFQKSGGTLPVFIRGGDIQLKGASRVLFNAATINLLENATEAIKKNSSRRDHRIEFHIDVVDGYGCLRVSDTGCGMSPETLADFMQEGFSTKPTDGHKHGIGTQVISRCFEQHLSGKITASSTINNGTSFVISGLPLA